MNMGDSSSGLPSANLMSFTMNNYLLPASYNQVPYVPNTPFWNLGDSMGQDVGPGSLIASHPGSITQPSNNNNGEQGHREQPEMLSDTEQLAPAPSLPLQVVPSTLSAPSGEPSMFAPPANTSVPQSHERAPPEESSSVLWPQVPGGVVINSANGDQVAQATRATETTSNPTNNISSSGTSAAPGALSPAPLGQGASSYPQRPSRTHHEIPTCPTTGESDEQTEQIFVERVVPAKGDTTGGPEIVILGENFPETVLYVRFGDSIARAVGNI